MNDCVDREYGTRTDGGSDRYLRVLGAAQELRIA
jgi:hypothetical protein